MTWHDKTQINQSIYNPTNQTEEIHTHTHTITLHYTPCLPTVPSTLQRILGAARVTAKCLWCVDLPVPSQVWLRGAPCERQAAVASQLCAWDGCAPKASKDPGSAGCPKVQLREFLRQFINVYKLMKFMFFWLAAICLDSLQVRERILVGQLNSWSTVLTLLGSLLYLPWWDALH